MSNLFRDMVMGIEPSLTTARAKAAYALARSRRPALAGHETIEALLEYVRADAASGWSERQAVTVALITELRTSGTGEPWSALLILAYYPMLSHLRHRIYGNPLEAEELNQLVITSFLDVAASLDLERHADRISAELKWRTARGVFGALRREQQERLIRAELAVQAAEGQLSEQAPEPAERDSEAVVRTLVQRAGGAVSDADLKLVVSTLLDRTSLRTYAACSNADSEPAERRYQRLKKRRARALQRMRSLAEAVLDESDAAGASETMLWVARPPKRCCCLASG